jgi:hypothetical protein
VAHFSMENPAQFWVEINSLLKKSMIGDGENDA